MTTLIFKNKKLKGILKITQLAMFQEAISAYEKNTGKKYSDSVNLNKYYEQTNPTLLLVKDEGIYLMASAKLKEIPKDNSHVCYAEGFEPDTPNSWEKCRRAVGGDDFVEEFAFSGQLQKGVMNGGDIQINICSEYFEVQLLIHQ